MAMLLCKKSGRQREAVSLNEAVLTRSLVAANLVHLKGRKIGVQFGNAISSLLIKIDYLL